MLSCTPMTKMAFFLVLRLLSIRAYASAYCPGCAAPRPPALLQLRTREVLHRKDWMLLEHVAGNCLEASAEAHNGIRPSLQPCEESADGKAETALALRCRGLIRSQESSESQQRIGPVFFLRPRAATIAEMLEAQQPADPTGLPQYPGVSRGDPISGPAAPLSSDALGLDAEDLDKDGGDALTGAFQVQGILCRAPEYADGLLEVSRSLMWGRAIVEETACELAASSWEALECRQLRVLARVNPRDLLNKEALRPMPSSLTSFAASWGCQSSTPPNGQGPSAAAVDAAADGSCWGNTEGAFRTFVNLCSYSSCHSAMMVLQSGAEASCIAQLKSLAEICGQRLALLKSKAFKP
eukprot:g8938.t1